MKFERVYRELLYRRIEHNQSSFTERALAGSCSVSLGLVDHALRPLRRMGAVEIMRRGFTLTDPWKILMYWCTTRNLTRDVVFSTWVPEPVHRIESELPAPSIPTAFTAYMERFRDAPADYSEVYAYGAPDHFVKRFGRKRGAARPNLFVLRGDEHLESLGAAPIAQIYADLWNLDSWYARAFLVSLTSRLRRDLGEEFP